MRVLYMIPLLLLSLCQPDETISAYAGRGSSWELVSHDNQPFETKASLTFSKKGQVTGIGPCNSFSAQQLAPYPWIEIREIAATRRACPGLAEETAYLSALPQMTLAEVSGNTLILSDDTGRQLIFERMTTELGARQSPKN